MIKDFEKELHISKLEHELQYWHSVINAYVFQNELPSTLILGTINDDSAVGCFDGEFEPNLILFNAEKLNDINLEDSTEIEKMIVMLFHEMIHQYCFVNGIYDVDEYTGEHLDAFYNTANRLGLYGTDYNNSYLNGWIKELFREQIKLKLNASKIAQSYYELKTK